MKKNRKIADNREIKVACRLYQSGFTYREIANFFDIDESTVAYWKNSEAWQEEIKITKNEECNLILQNTLILNRFKYYLEQTEENCKAYKTLVKQLIIKVMTLSSKPELKSAEIRDLKGLVTSLKDLDGLFRENLSFYFQVDEIVAYINAQKYNH